MSPHHCHCRRLHTQRHAAGLFDEWDDLAAALGPLLHAGTDGAGSDPSGAAEGGRAAAAGSSGIDASATAGADDAAGVAGDGAGDGSDAASDAGSGRLVMPSQAELYAARGWQLVKAIQAHGGLVAVARRLGVDTRRGCAKHRYLFRLIERSVAAIHCSWLRRNNNKSSPAAWASPPAASALPPSHSGLLYKQEQCQGATPHKDATPLHAAVGATRSPVRS